MITVNGREVKNPLAQFLLGATIIVLIICLLVLFAAFALIMIPFFIMIIIFGLIVDYGSRHDK